MKFTKKSKTSKLHKSSFSPNSLAFFKISFWRIILLFLWSQYSLSVLIPLIPSSILYFPMSLIIYIYFYIFTFIFEFQTHLFNYFSVICLHCISKMHFSPSGLKTKYSIFSKTCHFFCFSNLKITLFNRYYDNKISDIAPDSSGNRKRKEKISNK